MDEVFFKTVFLKNLLKICIFEQSTIKMVDDMEDLLIRSLFLNIHIELI